MLLGGNITKLTLVWPRAYLTVCHRKKMPWPNLNWSFNNVTYGYFAVAGRFNSFVCQFLRNTKGQTVS